MSIIREPVLVINLIKAALALAIAFGIVVTADQTDAIVQFATAALALAAVFGVGAKLERDAVTPVAAPRLPEDTVVQVTSKETGQVVAENVTSGAA